MKNGRVSMGQPGEYEHFSCSDFNSGHFNLYQVELNTLPAGPTTNGHIGAKTSLESLRAKTGASRASHRKICYRPPHFIDMYSGVLFKLTFVTIRTVYFVWLYSVLKYKIFKFLLWSFSRWAVPLILKKIHGANCRWTLSMVPVKKC